MEMRMRRVSTFLSLATMVLLLSSGCSVGKGVGAASGKIFEYGCAKDGDYRGSDGTIGTETNPADYDLRPSFFAGEPIDDLRQYSSGSENLIMDNRLTIRLQRSGKRIDIGHDCAAVRLQRIFVQPQPAPAAEAAGLLQ